MRTSFGLVRENTSNEVVIAVKGTFEGPATWYYIDCPVSLIDVGISLTDVFETSVDNGPYYQRSLGQTAMEYVRKSRQSIIHSIRALVNKKYDSDFCTSEEDKLEEDARRERFLVQSLKSLKAVIDAFEAYPDCTL